MIKPWLYTGTVMHRRIEPQAHAFAYPAFFICFPLREKQALKSRLFSLNRFNLFSFHEADHGNSRDSSTWIQQLLAEQGLHAVDGDIHLLCLPRVLGFVFNPVSFWLCHDRAGLLQCVVCEVNNTFGERHYYLLTAADAGGIKNDTVLRAEKVFHVSPFFPVAGEYRFRFQEEAGQRRIYIDYYQNQQLMLATALCGKPETMTDGALLALLARLGWSTVMVMVRIHWQALKLWKKGITFHRKPRLPEQEISR